jgi:hypothetical protein
MTGKIQERVYGIDQLVVIRYLRGFHGRCTYPKGITHGQPKNEYEK